MVQGGLRYTAPYGTKKGPMMIIMVDDGGDNGHMMITLKDYQ